MTSMAMPMAMPMPGMGGPQPVKPRDTLAAEVAHLHIANYQNGVASCQRLWAQHLLEHKDV